MCSRWIYPGPIGAGVCQVVQEDLAPEQIMRHSLTGVKNPQRVTYSREVRSDRECLEEFPCRITGSPGCIPLHPLVFHTWPAPSCHSCALGTGEISSLSAGQKAVIRRKQLQAADVLPYPLYPSGPQNGLQTPWHSLHGKKVILYYFVFCVHL